MLLLIAVKIKGTKLKMKYNAITTETFTSTLDITRVR